MARKTNKPEETKTTKSEIEPEVERTDDEFSTKELELAIQGMASISKQVKEDMVKIDKRQLRYFVDAYYQAQSDRITKDSQLRSVLQGYDDGEDHSNLAMKWLANNKRNEEEQIKKMLDAYTSSDPIGKWIKSVTGIGPVMASAFLAYFDISKCQYAGQFLSYAGLNDHNNPWLGTDKAKDIVDIVYTMHDIKMRSINDALKKYHLSYKAFEKKVKTLTKSAYKVGDVYDKIVDDSETAGIIAIYEAHYDEIYEAAKAAIKVSYENIMSQYGCDISEYEDILESANPSMPSFRDGEIVIPKYLTKAVEALRQFRMPDSIDTQVVADLMMFMTSKLAVTSDILDLTVMATGRSIRSIENGVYNLKKKEENKKPATKGDLVKYLAKPPFNTSLKVVCYLLGESFCKVSGKEKSLYGRLYKERKAYETAKNMRGEYADQAVNALISKNWDKSTPTYKAYSEGRLSAAHIDQRAKRFAVKVFLVHLFEIMYINEYHQAPPVYFTLEHMGHHDYIEPEVPYAEYVDVPKKYYEEYGIYNHIKSMKGLYGLDN